MMVTRKPRDKRSAGLWLGALDKHYDALILANGTSPSKGLFETLRPRCDELIALDGGVNVVQRWKIPPQHVIGDLDSVSSAALRWARKSGSEIHLRPSQESADIDKAFVLCRRLNYRNILVTAADGDALDHVMNSISTASAIRGLRVTFITQRVIAQVIRGRVKQELRVPEGHTLSWFGCPQAGPCSIAGVVWPFENRVLRMGEFNSLSNLPGGSSKVTLRQAAGVSLFTVSLRPKPRRSLILSA